MAGCQYDCVVCGQLEDDHCFCSALVLFELCDEMSRDM